MASVFFIRHGQTVWNLEHRIAGVTDVALTEDGRRQARAAAEELIRSGVHIDEIWSSPLTRAMDTAEIISRATGIPWRIDRRLKEQDFGCWEGQSSREEGFLSEKQQFARRCGGGESMLHVAQRVYNLLDALREEPDRTRLLVAHNGIARVVYTYFREMTNEEYARWSLPNCRPIRFDFP
ncbi:MAG: histidine phosphatase family protein [Oscillospiraceae bacterium]|nr:histidine phosphatase family protein [Oscillospiraceae bacterium]